MKPTKPSPTVKAFLRAEHIGAVVDALLGVATDPTHPDRHRGADVFIEYMTRPALRTEKTIP